jgi:hypothetical protein
MNFIKHSKSINPICVKENPKLIRVFQKISFNLLFISIQHKFDGKEWYILVVQPENYTTPDPIGIMLMSYMVSGMVYCFKEKKNRDDVAKWVMRKLDAGEKM